MQRFSMSTILGTRNLGNTHSFCAGLITSMARIRSKSWISNSLAFGPTRKAATWMGRFNNQHNAWVGSTCGRMDRLDVRLVELDLVLHHFYWPEVAIPHSFGFFEHSFIDGAKRRILIVYLKLIFANWSPNFCSELLLCCENPLGCRGALAAYSKTTFTVG